MLGSRLWSCSVYSPDQVFDGTGQTVAFVSKVCQEDIV